MSKVLHAAKYARSIPLALDWSRVLYIAYNTRWSDKHRKAALEAVAEESKLPVTDDMVIRHVDRYTTDAPHKNVTHTLDDSGTETVITDHSNRGREPGWVVWKEV